MKKTSVLLLLTALLASCEKPNFSELEDYALTDQSETKTKKFTFTIKGDFFGPAFNEEFTYGEGTRAYLTADGQNMTDLWVFDFVNNECVQSIHQSSSDDDFGVPSLPLTYGSHHVYFVASRGTTPEMDATNCTITWAKPSDTFWKDYAVTVVSTSNGNRAVTLDRVVTKLKITATDEVPEEASTMTITPTTWYYGLNYVTGEPAGAVSEQMRSVTIPTSYHNTTGKLTMSIFGFSSATQWTTDAVVTAKDDAGAVIGEATITAAPFIRNRATEYSGPLFGASGAANITLNTEWATSYSGEW